jgi:hypothetical protein
MQVKQFVAFFTQVSQKELFLSHSLIIFFCIELIMYSYNKNIKKLIFFNIIQEQLRGFP